MEKAHPETIRFCPPPPCFFSIYRYIRHRSYRVASPGGGRRDRVSYNYSGGRERAVAILVRCSSLSAATTFSSSSNNSLLSTALFLTTASNNGRGWEEEDLGEKVWFFLLLLLLSSCNIVTVNFWFWLKDFREKSSKILKRIDWKWRASCDLLRVVDRCIFEIWIGRIVSSVVSLNSKYRGLSWNSLRCEGIFELERNEKAKLWSGFKPRISWKNCFAIRVSSAWLRRKREIKFDERPERLFRIYSSLSSPTFAYFYRSTCKKRLIVKTIGQLE